MARRSKVVFCLLLAFLYVVVNICPLRAEALPEVMSGSTTLADNIMSYFALSGSAVANSEWINTLYSAYGTDFGTIEELANQGYLVLNDSGVWEATETLVSNIQQQDAYYSLLLTDMFNVSAEEAAAGGGFAAASGASVLAGSLGGVASTGVLPLFGGVTAAYWGGIALGTLIAHKIGLYGERIENGIPIDAPNGMMSNVVGPSAYCYCKYNNSQNISYRLYSLPNGIPYSYINGTSIIAGCYNPTNSKQTGKTVSFYIDRDGLYHEQTATNVNVSSKSTGATSLAQATSNNKYGFASANHFNSEADFNNALAGWRNGTIQPNAIKSPDLIGENGNLQSSEGENGGITVPDMKPQIDPGTQAGKPLTLPDWLNFANAVQNNNNNTAPSGSPDNASLFDNILDLIRTVIPENVPNPNPNPNPDPYSPPVVTPVPDPSYPDPVPDQQITENPEESENPQQTENPIDTGKPWRLPDLKNKFPFCIPWDIAKVFSKLKVNSRQAPHISWRFNPPNTPIDYTFNLDLEDFEEVATLLRTLELLGFIVGLAFATRYLIGAN